MLPLLHDVLLFALAVLGGGAALAPRARSSTLEGWCIGVAWAVGLLGAGVFIPYALGLATSWYAAGYLALLGAMLLRRDNLLAVLRDTDAQRALLCWALLIAGCFLLLACMPSYSGGAWMGDWEEHYQRPRLLLHLRAEDAEFRALFPFTSRPPLANAVDAAFLRVTGAAFPRHQTFMLLLNTLAFFPAALFARTFQGGRAASAWVALCLLLNPMFLQNATYAWTKSLTSFFVLLAVHLLFAEKFTPRRAITGFAVLGLGVVTHYSACVWLLAFGGPWLIVHRAEWRQPRGWRVPAGAALAFSAPLLPWLGFALARYGGAGTFGANSTVVSGAQFTWRQHAWLLVEKLWTTLVPHPLRSFDRSVLAQANPWTEFRDEVFYVYQSNLFFALGTPALLLLGWIAWRRDWPHLPAGRGWLVAVPLVVFLGTAVHGTPDDWGVAHICLQPLVILGVALAAARLGGVFSERAWRWLAAAVTLGWLADFFLGIALHYTAAGYQLNRAPGQSLLDYVATLSRVTQHNFWQKVRLQQDYFADTFERTPAELLLGYAVVVLLLAWCLRRFSAPPPPAPPATH